MLQGHSGLVKGVAWDPIGKYLASQSDDRTVRVWRTYDWKAETVVSEPFKEVLTSTYRNLQIYRILGCIYAERKE